MEMRRFGDSDFSVSVIGFGAWAIGGPAMAGSLPLGWGNTDDAVSKLALGRAKDLGINFFDTADFYGLGHSEELIGSIFGNRDDVLIATKVGHRIRPDQTVALDFAKQHILKACEQSLRRLRRGTIDHYQLHSAKLPHLEQGECIEAMELLRASGKVRSWGLSLNTFRPEIEAAYLMDRKLGDGFQLVLNAINQRALPILERASTLGYGIIARMPLQFGLLTGKFSRETRFPADDHRSLRLRPDVLSRAMDGLEEIWPLADRYTVSRTALSLSFAASVSGVSTVIPGIRTPEQAEANTAGIVQLSADDMEFIRDLYRRRFSAVVDLMQQAG
jgi:aryl-alcohol dehydrogenase-like predicted oxidoreductase